MPHIHTDPGQHDHTVSIYIVRTDFNEPKIMLHLHRKANLYAQFGGHVELDETPWQAATHELREEAGYDLSQLMLLQPANRLKRVGNATVHPQPVVHATMGYITDKHHFHTDSTYALIAETPPPHAPHDGESTDIQAFSRDEIISHPQIDDITRDIAMYILDTAIHEWRPLSAATFV